MTNQNASRATAFAMPAISRGKLARFMEAQLDEMLLIEPAIKCVVSLLWSTDW